MGSEQESLGKLYAEMGDEHLRDMAAEMDDLTDDARLALTHELQRRGITSSAPAMPAAAAEVTEEPELESGFGPGIPGMFPSSAAVMEQALEPAQPSKDGLSALISFYDGLELSKACGFLEDAEMEPVIEAIDGDAQSGVPPRFELWLDTRDIDTAKNLLRVKMGLFPLQEVDDEGYLNESVTGLVGTFATAEEAEEVRLILVSEGIPATAEHEEENGMWEVMVAPEAQQRAVAAVAAGMDLS